MESRWSPDGVQVDLWSPCGVHVESVGEGEVQLIRAKQADSDPLCLKDENCGRRTNEQPIDRTQA